MTKYSRVEAPGIIAAKKHRLEVWTAIGDCGQLLITWTPVEYFRKFCYCRPREFSLCSLFIPKDLFQTSSCKHEITQGVNVWTGLKHNTGAITFYLCILKPELLKTRSHWKSFPVSCVPSVTSQALVEGAPKIKIVATTVVFATPRLWLLLVRDLLVKVRMWEGSHTPLLLPHSPLSVPALEEDLLRIRVQQANNPKVCHHLSSCNVQFFETWTVSANLVEKHVVRDVSFQRQLGEALAIHYHRIESRAAKIIFRWFWNWDMGPVRQLLWYHKLLHMSA